MSITVLLDRLQSVRRVGPDRWLAQCPAHDDNRPSLSIRDSDGCVLVKCWAGCEVADVLRAVGLKFDVLFPERGDHHRGPEKRPFPAADVLRAVASDAMTVAVAGSHLGNGGLLTDADRAAVVLAAARLAAAVEESRHA